MKNNRISILIAAVIMIIAIGIISALSVDEAKDRGGVMFFVFGGKAELRNTIELPLSEVDWLQLLYTSKNLDIYPAEGDTIIIKEYLISDKAEARAQVSTLRDENTGRRSVTVTGGKATVITIFGFFTGRERIEVYIPKEGLEALELQTGSGNITVEENFALEAEELRIQTGSGNIKWYDTEAEELHLTAGSGNIRMERMHGSITAEAGSGNIKLTDGKGSVAITAGSGNVTVERFMGDANVQTGSGNITVEQFSGQGSMGAGSGSVRVEVLEATGDMKLKTGSGGIHLALPKELSFELEIQTGSGNIHTSFDNELSYNRKGNHAEGMIGENPVCKISAEANSGNVKITADS